MNIRRAFLTALGAIVLACCAPVAAPAQTPESNVMITLTRSVCFGFCPAYRVTISGDGEVVYVGERHVAVTGEQRARIPRSEVQALLRRFEEIGFNDLRDEYRARVTDLPTYTITLERGGQRKTVVDYAGTSAGMPPAVRELEEEIDRVAGTARWVLRDGQPVRERPRP